MNTTTKVPSITDCIRINEAAHKVHDLLAHWRPTAPAESVKEAVALLNAALNLPPPPAEPIPPAEISVAIAEFQATVEKHWPNTYSFVRQHGLYLSFPVHNMWVGWALAKGLIKAGDI